MRTEGFQAGRMWLGVLALLLLLVLVACGGRRAQEQPAPPTSSGEQAQPPQGIGPDLLTSGIAGSGPPTLGRSNAAITLVEFGDFQ